MPTRSRHRPADADVRPRKEPRQQRASATRDALLAAAAQVLEREGLSAFNTNRVAEVAGLSVGSLYQYYPNKGAMLVALRAQHAEACVVALDQALGRSHAARSLAQTVGIVVQVLLRQRLSHPRLAAALDYAEHEALTAAALHLQRDVVHARLAVALAAHRGELRGRPPELARDLCSLFQGLVNAAVARGEAPGPALRRRVERAVLGYLVTPRS